VVRAGQTKTIPPAVQSVTSLLRRRLDKEMLLFKRTQPEFYAGYSSARVIVDRGGAAKAKKVPPLPGPTAK